MDVVAALLGMLAVAVSVAVRLERDDVVASSTVCSRFRRSSDIRSTCESVYWTLSSGQPSKHGLLVQHPTNLDPESHTYQVSPDEHRGEDLSFDQRRDMVSLGSGCPKQDHLDMGGSNSLSRATLQPSNHQTPFPPI